MYFQLYKYISRALGYNISKAKKYLLALEDLSSDDFWKVQIEKRNRIYQFHQEHSKWYQDFSNNISIDNWENIPIVKKEDLQEYNKFNNRLGVDRLNDYVASTSGSSGHPFKFRKNKESHSLAWAKAGISYSQLGIEMGHKEARFIGHLRGAGAYRKKIYEKIKNLILNRHTFNIFDLSDNNMLVIYKYIEEGSFDYIYGYTEFLLSFSRFIIISGSPVLSEICPQLKGCIVTAEMCTEADRKVLERGFGVSVFREYGASEVSIIAIEDKNLDWWVSADRLWVEIVNDEYEPVSEGESGKIVITDLYNRAFPFIRYEIGDIGAVKKSVNYPFLKLSKLSGRISDTIVLPSGKKAPGLTFYYISRSILEKGINLKQFRIIQRRVDLFIFQIVTISNINSEIKTTMQKEAEKYLEAGIVIELQIVEKIEAKYSNKIQHFFSEMEPG